MAVGVPLSSGSMNRRLCVFIIAIALIVVQSTKSIAARSSSSAFSSFRRGRLVKVTFQNISQTETRLFPRQRAVAAVAFDAFDSEAVA